MEGYHELAIIEVGEPLVDAANRYEANIDHELIERREDRLGEVVIEGEL